MRANIRRMLKQAGLVYRGIEFPLAEILSCETASSDHRSANRTNSALFSPCMSPDG